MTRETIAAFVTRHGAPKYIRTRVINSILNTGANSIAELLKLDRGWYARKFGSKSLAWLDAALARDGLAWPKPPPRAILR